MILEMTTSALICYNSMTTRGASATARYVAAQGEKGRRSLQESFYFGLAGKGVFDDLFAAAEECSAPNWDGQGAAPVAQETYRIAYQFSEALPLGTPAPSVGVEPDGQLTLEWYCSPRRTLSVSISPEGDLHYAALLGPSKTYGTEPFFGSVPKPIIELISRVMAA